MDEGVVFHLIDKEKRDFHLACPDRYGLLKEYAKELRRKPTEAERALWQMLKGKSLGVSVKRQYVILDFIADFYIPEQQLIIEVDGGYHNSPDQITLDESREKRLRNVGYNILRFTNEEVLADTERVVKDIYEYIHL